MTLDFSQSNVLIIGDIILDKYYFGTVERISPEAPVPIVNISKEENRLGGAANVANNISSLGGCAFLTGTLGHDFFGKEIERQLREKGIRASFVKTNEPTITKARVIGGKQQIVRLDYERKITLSSEEEKTIRENITQHLHGYKAMVISDYGKGLISDSLCYFLIREAQKHQIPTIVDPKGKNWEKYAGAEIVTPNLKELSDVVGYKVNNDDQEVETAAKTVLQEKKIKSILVTRSEKGMSLISGTETCHIPTHSEEVFDVSGAGDTVVATLSICLASGIEIIDAIRIANIAAGIVVKKIGTATATIRELNEALCSK